MTSIYILHVSAEGCHPQGVLIGYNAISRDFSPVPADKFQDITSKQETTDDLH
jgi:hypothetical protein